MTSDFRLSGIYVPLITPLAKDGSVALDEVESLAKSYLDAGASGIVALGTTGEPATMSSDEKHQVIQRVARVCGDYNKACIIGAGTNSTSASIEAALEAVRVGGDNVNALLCVVPYYTKPSEAGIVAHYKAIAEASPVPLVLYNIPGRTGRALGSTALTQLSAVPNICGVKQAVGGIEESTLILLSEKDQSFDVVAGDDPFILPLVLMGGTGAIAASAHVCTSQFVQLVECAQKGDLPRARKIAEALLPVCQALFLEPNPCVTKGVLHAQGKISTPDLRLPMTRAHEESVSIAMNAIKHAEEALS